MAPCILGNDIAIELHRIVSGTVVEDIHVDPAVVLRFECCRILSRSICLCSKTFERHRAAKCLHRLAGFRTADINFRHARDRRRTAGGADAPCRLQRRRRSRVVDDEMQRCRIDIERLVLIVNGSGFLYSGSLAAGLHRQDYILGIDIDILIRLDCAAVHIRAVLIENRRVLRKAIGTVILPYMGIDVLLIRCRTEETLREFRRRLLVARRKHRRAIA